MLHGTVHAQANLLTHNPGFEDGGTDAHGHGVFSLPGWQIEQADYKWNSVNVGDDGAMEGKRACFVRDGGRLTTAADARAAVRPGYVYELRFQAKKTRDETTWAYEGAKPSLLFYDKSGAQIQEVRGNEAEFSGTSPWQAFTVRGLAPAGAVQAGVQVTVTEGVYPHIDAHDFAFDDFRLRLVLETQDRLRVRSAPRLVQPGRTETVTVRYAALGPRTVIVSLMRGGRAVCFSKQTGNGGRGLLTFRLPVPAAAPDGAYAWRVTSTEPAGKVVAQAGVADAFADSRASGSGTVDADSPDIFYSGRINLSDRKAPVLYWPGSMIRTRFQGTSAAARFTTNDAHDKNPYLDCNFVAVVDGDAEHVHRFSAGTNHPVVSVVSGLPDGAHTLDIYKNTDLTDWAVFHGLTLDPGKGLLRPEPLPTHRIEFYGDSVTEGGSPDPNTPYPDRSNDGDYSADIVHTFAALTANALGWDGHYIAKGGIGVSGSYVPYTMLDIWNTFDFNGYVPQEASAWKFSQWTPDVVVVAIGQNDRTRKPSGEAFVTAYQTLVRNLRKTYPNADIFCTNTVMSGPDRQWLAAVPPLLSDPKVHFQLFDPDQGHSGHPRADDHQAMATGNDRWDGLADWIEDTLY